MALKGVIDFMTWFSLDPILLIKAESQGFNEFK